MAVTLIDYIIVRIVIPITVTVTYHRVTSALMTSLIHLCIDEKAGELTRDGWFFGVGGGDLSQARSGGLLIVGGARGEFRVFNAEAFGRVRVETGRFLLFRATFSRNGLLKRQLR